MKRALGLCSLLLLVTASAASTQERRDAVAVDPTHHHVILENDHVRVFEVLAAPGARSPMHTHAPTVVVSLSKARASMTGPDGATVIFDLNPAQVLWLENAEHSWNLLSGQVHVIGVEVKAAQRGDTPTVLPQDPRDAVAVDPTHHQVILENDYVRVLEALVAPGAKSPMHTHPPLLAISLSKARLNMTGPDGATVIFDLNPAQVFWIENAEHSWEMLSGQAHVIGVEVKSAR
jgi:quercetin dioxygenase-like cupin family protein